VVIADRLIFFAAGVFFPDVFAADLFFAAVIGVFVLRTALAVVSAAASFLLDDEVTPLARTMTMSAFLAPAGKDIFIFLARALSSATVLDVKSFFFISTPFPFFPVSLHRRVNYTTKPRIYQTGERFARALRFDKTARKPYTARDENTRRDNRIGGSDASRK
jgi:hypothetical protein